MARRGMAARTGGYSSDAGDNSLLQPLGRGSRHALLRTDQAVRNTEVEEVKRVELAMLGRPKNFGGNAVHFAIFLAFLVIAAFPPGCLCACSTSCSVTLEIGLSTCWSVWLFTGIDSILCEARRMQTRCKAGGIRDKPGHLPCLHWLLSSSTNGSSTSPSCARYLKLRRAQVVYTR
ncbi:hypothetical protein GGR56DRAFT_599098 [Xylariaceae sp. FL0804]|nr:hypothetical protein GGR56DRAFT_599098 [Xylariaceae sp. FL0804]